MCIPVTPLSELLIRLDYLDLYIFILLDYSFMSKICNQPERFSFSGLLPQMSVVTKLNTLI